MNRVCYITIVPFSEYTLIIPCAYLRGEVCEGLGLVGEDGPGDALKLLGQVVVHLASG